MCRWLQDPVSRGLLRSGRLWTLGCRHEPSTLPSLHNLCVLAALRARLISNWILDVGIKWEMGCSHRGTKHEKAKVTPGEKRPFQCHLERTLWLGFPHSHPFWICPEQARLQYVINSTPDDQNVLQVVRTLMWARSHTLVNVCHL